jgi:molecular chaperone DnaK
MSDVVIGIDLGTTYSCVAVVEHGTPRVLEQKGGLRTMPSVVGFNPDGSSMVGHIAKRQAVTNPENTVFGSKRIIGRSFTSEEVAKALKSFPYKITQGPNRDPRVQILGKNFPIQEISSILLKHLKQVAEEALQTKVEKAVITVPAYFSDGQRQATKDAGAIAGLEVLRIINEPTAAALAFGFNKRTNKKIAVYDLGGGTFDISILEITGDTFEVLSTAGDTYLGGEDFDQKIVDHIVKSFQHQAGVDLTADKLATQRLKDAAEQAKIQLSSSLEAEINLPFIINVQNESKHLKYNLSRAEFEKIGEEFVNRTLSICQSALDMASLKVENLDEVLLVGGMTRMPLVQSKVKDFFKRMPAKNVHPDEAVALGAAILAHSLSQEESPVLLLDVTPMSLGIRTAGGFSSIIIPRNSTIPTQASHIFTTVADNQSSVKIKVIQGENKTASENDMLGEFTLTEIAPAKAGTPEIEVSFAIDSNGILQVAARDLKTGKEQSLVVTARSDMSESERDELIERHRNDVIKLHA